MNFTSVQKRKKIKERNIEIVGPLILPTLLEKMEVSTQFSNHKTKNVYSPQQKILRLLMEATDCKKWLEEKYSLAFRLHVPTV